MAALTVAAYGPTHLHPRQWTALRQLWAQLEFWANCLIFVLASMLAADVLLQISWLYVWGVAGRRRRRLRRRARWSCSACCRCSRPSSSSSRSTRRYKAILVWGGLRGAVTIVLAMVAAGDERLARCRSATSSPSRPSLFVLFTLFVNATTLGLVMRVLGLDKLSRLELALRDRVLALSRINVDRHLQQIIRQHNERTDGIDVDPASAGDAERRGRCPPDLALDLDERVKIGLVTLCTREKELYLEQFEQQILSRRMVAILAARADRLIDTVRDKGVAGLRGMAGRDFASPTAAFASRCGCIGASAFERMLTERLADRFEILMVSLERPGRARGVQRQLDRRPAGHDAEAAPGRR